MTLFNLCLGGSLVAAVLAVLLASVWIVLAGLLPTLVHRVIVNWLGMVLAMFLIITSLQLWHSDMCPCWCKCTDDQCPHWGWIYPQPCNKWTNE